MALATVGAVRGGGGASASAGAAGSRSGRGASAGGRGFAAIGNAGSPLSGHATYAAAISRAQEGAGGERATGTNSNESGARGSVKNKGKSFAQSVAKSEGKLDAYIRSFHNPTAEAAEMRRDANKAAAYQQASAAINKTVMSAAGEIGGALGSVLAALVGLAQQQQQQE